MILGSADCDFKLSSIPKASLKLKIVARAVKEVIANYYTKEKISFDVIYGQEKNYFLSDLASEILIGQNIGSSQKVMTFNK